MKCALCARRTYLVVALKESTVRVMIAAITAKASRSAGGEVMKHKKPKFIGVDLATNDGDYTAKVYGYVRRGAIYITAIKYSKLRRKVK